MGKKTLSKNPKRLRKNRFFVTGLLGSLLIMCFQNCSTPYGVTQNQKSQASSTSSTPISNGQPACNPGYDLVDNKCVISNLTVTVTPSVSPVSDSATGGVKVADTFTNNAQIGTTKNFLPSKALSSPSFVSANLFDQPVSMTVSAQSNSIPVPANDLIFTCTDNGALAPCGSLNYDMSKPALHYIQVTATRISNQITASTTYVTVLYPYGDSFSSMGNGVVQNGISPFGLSLCIANNTKNIWVRSAGKIDLSTNGVSPNKIWIDSGGIVGLLGSNYGYNLYQSQSDIQVASGGAFLVMGSNFGVQIPVNLVLDRYALVLSWGSNFMLAGGSITYQQLNLSSCPQIANSSCDPQLIIY